MNENSNFSISVVIPAYNCEKTIKKVLDSVLSQSRIDLIREIIIVNDGSTDKTDEIIKKYIEVHHDIPIVYLIHENRGVSFTRNRGIRAAKGSWIALLDSDDIWFPSKIEKQFDAIVHNDNIKFLGSAKRLKFFVKTVNSGIYKLNAKELCIRNVPQTPSVLFNKEAGISLGLFNEKMRYGEDINFYQKFLTLDSYYILIEELVKTGIGKFFFAQSGLTANLKKMHLGRNQNVKELYEMKLISKKYMWLMLICNQFKYYRRLIIQKINLISFRK